MVFHVAGDQIALLLAFELVEQHAGLLAQRVHQHIQTPAVGHADDDFLDAHGAAGADQLIHRQDHRFAALERETLLADKTGMQVTLQGFGSGNRCQETFFVSIGIALRIAGRLVARLDPALLRHIRDVHVFGADMAAVAQAQGFENLAQRGFLDPHVERTGAERGR